MAVNLSLLAGAGAQFFDDTGNVLTGGKLYTYLAGTTTPAVTYTTSAGNVAHANPIVLNAAGRVPSSGEIWLTDNVSYKFIVKTTDDVLIATYDNITGNSSGILTAFSAPNGSSLVGYIEGSAGSVATTVQAALRRTVWVEDFLPAGFDYATGDATAYIQAAINSGAGQINFKDETYLISSPIYLDGGQALIGQGSDYTTIRKTTTTVGTGSNTARGGTVTDSYAKNAILIFRHPNDGYTYRTQIIGMTLHSFGHTTNYGIYAPRTSQTYLEDLNIYQCQYGWYTHDSWLNVFDRVVCNSNTLRFGGNNYGWPDATPCYGFVWADDGTGGPTGTTLTATDCWGRDCHYGWSLYGLQYSTLNSCASDNITFRAWRLHLSSITMNGCGMENVNAAQSGLSIEDGQTTINNFNAYGIFGGTAGTTAMIFLSDARVTMNSCRFDNFTTPNTADNIVIQSNTKLVTSNTSFPSNGGGFISYSSGSQWVNLTNVPPTIQTTDRGAYVPGDVRGNELKQKTNKSIIVGGTDIATFTATTSLCFGVCEFTVSWYDSSFPTGAGISKFLLAVHKDAATYRENVSSVTTAYATNSGAGAPTYALTRVGDVWSLTMIPQDGACTAYTITAQMQNISGITLALP